MSITVYTLPSCVQCTATYRALDNQGAEYTVVDLSVDDSRLEEFKADGLIAAPIVEVLGSPTGDHRWSGFRPDMIVKVIA